MRVIQPISLVLCFLGLVLVANCLNNGLARTPPMGFMTWQRYRCITDCQMYPYDCISESLIKRTANYMAHNGYLDAGYEYIIIDDCWSEMERDKNNRLVPDHERFPSGMKALADYVHGLGLKFGIYADFGTRTCAGYPGSIDHMDIDAKTFAEWDVDYVKFDGCYSDLKDMDKGYPMFGAALNRTGRPMVYSCSLPAYQEFNMLPNYTAIKQYCNLWRNYGDIDDSWQVLRSIVKFFAANQTRFQPHAGPGHWNDPDMLIIGNYGLSYEESKTQMALWAIMAAPLLMSADLGAIRPEMKEILLNKDVIAINQDRLGIQGLRVYAKDGLEIWTRKVLPITNGYYSYAVAFVNYRTDGYPRDMTTNLLDIGLNHPNGYYMQDLFVSTKVIRNIAVSNPITVRINPSGVRMFKFTVKEFE